MFKMTFEIDKHFENLLLIDKGKIKMLVNKIRI